MHFTSLRPPCQPFHRRCIPIGGVRICLHRGHESTRAW